MTLLMMRQRCSGNSKPLKRFYNIYCGMALTEDTHTRQRTARGKGLASSARSARSTRSLRLCAFLFKHNRGRTDLAALARRYDPVSYTHLTLPTILRV